MSAINYFKEKRKFRYQEKIAEHAFSRDLLISGATQCKDVFISRSDSDIFGYDVIIQSQQLRKTMVTQLLVYNGETRVWYVDRKLLSSKTGQLILIQVEEKEKGLNFTYFIFNKKRVKEVLERQQPLRKSQPEKCKTKKSDYIKVPPNKLYNKLFG